MLWLLWQILWCLIAAFLLGAALMWLLWRVFGKRLGSFGGNFGGNFGGTSSSGVAVKGNLDASASGNSAALQESKAEIAALQKSKEEIAGKHASLEASLKTKDNEIAQLKAKAAEADKAKQQAGNAEASLKNKDNEIAQLKAKAAEADKTKQQLASNDKQLRDLENRLKNADVGAQQALSLQANLKSKDDEIARLKAQATEADKARQQAASKDSEIAQLKAKAAEADKAKQQATTAQNNLKSKDDEITKLKAQLDTAKTSSGGSTSNTGDSAALQESQAEINSLQARLAASTDAKVLKERDNKIGELEAQIASYKSAASGGKDIDYGSLLLTRDMQIVELEQDLTKQRVKSKDLEPDDLKKIKGVGPKMEDKLNDFGLYTYRGVGTMGPAQKYRLSQTLDGFQDRIERDEWVPQARELHYGKYNERLTDAPAVKGDASSDMWKEMAAKDKRIAELEAQASSGVGNSVTGNAGNSVSGSAGNSASEIAARDKRIAELEAQLRNSSSGSNGSSGSGNSSSERKVSQADHDKMMREAEAEAEVMRRRIKNKEIQADDLKEIHGVGPVMERTLNDFGVFTFKGVANLSEAQRYRLAENLAAFKDRIDRDDWVGQAKKLHKKKYNEDA